VIERELTNAVAAGAIAGAVVLVGDRHGVVHEQAAGRRAIDAAAPMTPDTVFWLASMTKAVTSVAALQLVERGLLALDGDLGDVLPELRRPEVLTGFDSDGAPRLRPASRPVTLRHLLTHTAGFGYAWLSLDLARHAEATGTPPLQSGLRAAYRLPLLFDPGECWAYGIGLDWVGFAIEAASGQGLDAWLAEHVLGPLGMKDTGFAPSAAARARQAALHARLPDGGLVTTDLGFSAEPEVCAGGSGLFGTAGDYLRFLRMLLCAGTIDGERVLEPETVEALSRIYTGPLRAGALASVAPELANDFDLFPHMKTGWGLATLINPDPAPTGRSAGSLAWGGLANTHYWADPARGLAGMILTQVLPFADPVVLDLFRALEAAAYGRPGAAWPQGSKGS
jgi:methyl acetate hydrolase